MDLKLEKVKYYKNLPVMIYKHFLKNGMCYVACHWHRDIEIDYVIRGKMCGIVQGESVPLEEGEFLFVNSAVVHGMEPLEFTYEDLRVMTIVLSYDFLLDIFPEMDEYVFELDKKEKIQEEIKIHMREIAEIYNRKLPHEEIKYLIQIYEIVWILLTKCLVKKEKSRVVYMDDSEKRICQVIKWVEKGYKTPQSLNEMASRIGMNPAYFSRYFKKMTGVNYLQYVKKVQLQYATENLLKTDESITNIAYNNGFPSVKSFIRMFKEIYHCTPKMYRETMKKK